MGAGLISKQKAPSYYSKAQIGQPKQAIGQSRDIPHTSYERLDIAGRPRDPQVAINSMLNDEKAIPLNNRKASKLRREKFS